MKQFLYAVLFILCFGFYAHEIVAKDAIQDNYIAQSALENQYIFSCPSDFFNHTANRENGQYSFQRLFPTFYKYSVTWNLLATETILQRKVRTISYVVYAENHIIRFEGKDIIHPFNYFW